ncbi:hypothetical protein C8E03_104192 [Lachnotalea glycerini]|uniref:Uncharacterized protein n=1 Tax=Lachnotalea glycerini TaxID=1763509 RepID=A0A318EWZ3_9FIRM|nr:hypothetical protein [Lachnotalea glycerini]OYO67738.1 hypothetical protein CG709_17445 [Lachnotalea glycerini]PXV91184.1 hypothetical protein C8E03_104192 [Lachnotalea glycerini]
MKKKLLSLLLGLSIAVTLVGCGSSNSDSGTSTTEATDAATSDSSAAITGTYPEEKILIGVELYDPTESETLAMQEYFAKLSETYNVEFKYSEAIADADAEMKFVEDCAMAGCKGYFGYYNVTGAQLIQSVIDYEMYFYGYYDEASYEEFAGDPYYLGCVLAGGNEYDKGKALGDWVVANGYKNVVYANGGADFGVGQFVDRQQGFLDAIGDDVTVTTVGGFPGDQFFADQAAALSTEGLEAVVASFNGLDFWAQPIASAGLTDKVALATIGSVNETYLSAFENNSVSLLVSNNIDTYGFVIPIICNAVDGNANALKTEGKAPLLSTDFWIVNNADDCKKLYEVLSGEGVFTAEQLMTLSVSNNPQASLATLEELAKTGSISAVLSK